MHPFNGPPVCHAQPNLHGVERAVFFTIMCLPVAPYVDAALAIEQPCRSHFEMYVAAVVISAVVPKLDTLTRLTYVDMALEVMALASAIVLYV